MEEYNDRDIDPDKFQRLKSVLLDSEGNIKTKTCKACKWFIGDAAGCCGWCCANDIPVSSNSKICEKNFEENN